MTRLTYEWTNDNIHTKEFSTWAEVLAQVERNGGHYVAKYTPIPEPCVGGVSEKRLAIHRERAIANMNRERVVL